LFAAGHHGVNATTVRVAEDLAQRMDYDTGHVRYCLKATAARLGMSEANLKKHVKKLREVGALAWVVHGTRTNVLRKVGLKGYAGTATVYAAVIPPVFDHAHGHTIVGSGYEARIVIDQRGQTPRNPVDNPPVENPGTEACEPPSLTVVNEVVQVQMVGGVTTTAQRQRKKSPARKTSSRKRATILGASVTTTGMQLGDKLARAIRQRVPWIRRATHDQLRWVCADMGEQQWTEDQAVRFAVDAGHERAAGFAWQPARPHRLLAAELRATQERLEQGRQMQEDLAQAVAWEDSTAAQEMADRASLVALFGQASPEKKPTYTDEERRAARMDWNNWPEVIAHFDEDQDDAVHLYGKRLVWFAIDQQARLNRQEAMA
jgi:DNA-binding transcriptional regulator YdaS (Cro superfamily)